MPDGNAGELASLRDWLRDGHGAALATVLSTWGSAPRPAGALLAIRDDGVFQGSVSAGCVEGAVIEQALAALADGLPRDLSFGVTSDTAFAVGLACGGTIRVHVDPAPALADVEQALAFQAARRSFMRAFALDKPGWTLTEDDAAREAGSCLENGVFRHAVVPDPRLIIVGAVHIAQFLSPMAALAGYEVAIVDPRTGYAGAERFGTTPVVTLWPGEALAALRPDARTAIVLLTHDPKLDDPAMAAALASPAFYIAALGSHRNSAARRERLAAQGHDEAALARIHGPAGLAIGAVSPAEIAVSILAELTAARRGRLAP